MSETIKTVGLVLNSKKHTADASRLLEIFSPELGKFSAVIRGVEKPKAKLAVASQPFCLGEYVLVQKNGYYTVIDCYVHDTFFDLAYNLDAYVLASSILEITSKLTLVGESNIELFSFLLNTLKLIAYEKAEPTIVTIKYLMMTLKKSGFGFDVSFCHVCKKSLREEKKVGLVYEGSGAICLADMHKMNNLPLTFDEWEVMKQINFADLEQIVNLDGFSREALTSVLKTMLKQFYYRTGEKIQSLEKY